MTATASVVLSNLAYLIGAVVLAALGGTGVWLRHRKPRSVDANVASFNRGLKALAPDGFRSPGAGAGHLSRAAPPMIEPRPGGLHVVRPGMPRRKEFEQAGSEEDAERRAGAEPG